MLRLLQLKQRRHVGGSATIDSDETLLSLRRREQPADYITNFELIELLQTLQHGEKSVGHLMRGKRIGRGHSPLSQELATTQRATGALSLDHRQHRLGAERGN